MIRLLISLALTALNPTYSPDSTRLAYTDGGNLFVTSVADSSTVQLTFDGSDVILNGRASWVYYEEIFGRSSEYRAFWWSPDSKKIAYYRFDQSGVPGFPIFSPAGQNGSLNVTRYPKAGQDNPSVRVMIADLVTGKTCSAAFDYSLDQYFGSPFWGDGSDVLYVQREPRRQNVLDLFAVNAADGGTRQVYHEEYPTWVDWIEGMLFDRNGLYMVRDFETGWQQIYHLGYDGTLKRLSGGCNWGISLIRQEKGTVWFTARRDSRTRTALYRLDRNGGIRALTDTALYARNVRCDGDWFEAELSTAAVPPRTVRVHKDGRKPAVIVKPAEQADESRPVPHQVRIANDGFDLYGLMTLPRGFDASAKYPVVIEVYGGPGTAYVRDWWKNRDATNRWCWENGIIWMVVDPRSSGENGRKGMDEAFRRMTVTELRDYIAWAKWLQSLPYVKADAIGVDGFSFGGTTVSMLVLRYPEYFRCGIAGGGVYDWHLYDTHYTERFMDTPQANPDGYDEACVLKYVREGRISPDYRPGSLKLTHGTGDDNVHFQNTLQLMDALQERGLLFDLMIYPDGMHGYRGKQHEHDAADAASFWSRELLEIK